MTKPKWYHYLLAAGSQDPDNPSPRMYNPYEEASAYANKDEDKLRKIHEDQIECEKKTAPVKAATAVVTATLPLWGPHALHVGKVLLNPATAKTALGGAVATTADLAGTGYGVKRNSELLDKWTSGNFNYSDPVEFGLNLIPGYGLSKGVKARTDMLERVSAFQKLKRAVKNTPSEVITNPWVVNENTGSTVYSGITLPGKEAKDFSEDVRLLQYYATHRPRVQRMNFMKEYPTGKYIGEGAEARVFDAGTDVEKVLDFDLATRRHLSPDHHVIRTADNPEELLQLIKSVQTSADFRNRHIFSMPVQPAIVRKPDGSYIGMFTQKKLIPLIKNPEMPYEMAAPLERKVADFMSRNFIQELYPVRGYNINNGKFNPWTEGPLDGHAQNWALDENGILWGIDIMKSGGQINPYR